jgi:hypothetical protein
MVQIYQELAKMHGRCGYMCRELFTNGAKIASPQNLQNPLLHRVVRNRFYIVSSRYGNLKGPVEQNNCIKFELNPLGFRACSVMAALEGQ